MSGQDDGRGRRLVVARSDVTEYTEAELHAGVEAARNWGTYVLVHVYTADAVQQAVQAGVQCIEHGQLVDEETVAMMADHGTWWCLQPYLDDDDAKPHPDPAKRAKQLEVAAGTDRAYELARKHEVKVAWGTDVLYDAKLAARQGARLAKLARWIPQPKSSAWRRPPTRSCSHFPGRATLVLATSASSARAHLPTYSS